MRRVLIRVVCLVVAIMAPPAEAAPRAELWARWQAHDPTSMRQIDHRAWEGFLMRYLRIGADGVHRVAYAEVSPADRRTLDAYIERLAAIPIAAYDRPEQMAYWINLYNALTVRLILDHYPIASVRDIGPAEDGPHRGPWDQKLVTVDDVTLSLDDIEHRILRPIWRDPRVHFALSCGAIGCPNLQPEPYRGEHIDRQLNEAAMAYVNDPRCIMIQGDRLMVSSIFRWYRQDFGDSDRAIINHLMAFAEPRLAMALQRFSRISDDGFDWRLNDAAS